VHFPREWIKVSRRTARGHDVAAWGWGETRADAERVATERLTRLLDRLEHGERPGARYGYGARPVREAVIDVVAGPTEAPEAVVTRNQYGALVLNTARISFIDVDVPPSTFPDAIGRLFGRPTPRAATLERIREGLAASGWAMTFRLYETAAGFRVMGVDRRLDPSGPDAAALMDAVGTDAAYKALCRGQHSYRARLTPKPWRCGLIAPPPGLQPGETGEDGRARAWLAEYERASAAYATCRFVETIGTARPDDTAQRVLEVHDTRTRADSALPLA
jgi:hypothetical protein